MDRVKKEFHFENIIILTENDLLNLTSKNPEKKKVVKNNKTIYPNFIDITLKERIIIFYLKRYFRLS